MRKLPVSLEAVYPPVHRKQRGTLQTLANSQKANCAGFQANWKCAVATELNS